MFDAKTSLGIIQGGSCNYNSENFLGATLNYSVFNMCKQLQSQVELHLFSFVSVFFFY